jgi:hypothetical protein
MTWWRRRDLNPRPSGYEPGPGHPASPGADRARAVLPAPLGGFEPGSPMDGRAGRRGCRCPIAARARPCVPESAQANDGVVDDEGAGQVHAAVASDVTAETAHRVDAGSHAPTRASKRQNGHSACVANTADLNEAILQGFTRDVIESDSAFEVLVRGWLWIDKALSALILAPLEAPEQLSQDALDWMRFEHTSSLLQHKGRSHGRPRCVR